MFGILKKVFGKTSEAIKEVAPEKKKTISKEEFEDILLEADVNYELVERLLEALPETINRIRKRAGACHHRYCRTPAYPDQPQRRT